jgi:membrane protein
MLVIKLWRMLRETADEWVGDKAPRMGAALAYYAIFSVAPLLLIAISIAAAVFGEEAARNDLHKQIGDTVGKSVAGAIEEVLGNVHRSGGGLLGTAVGVVILLFGASGVFTELQGALNTIWRVKPKPGSGVWGVVRNRLVSFFVVFGTGFFLLASLVLSAVLEGLERAVGERLAGGEWLWWRVNVAVSFAVVAVLFAMIYKLLPDTNVGWRDVWLGAVIAALLFTVGKYVIGVYLARGAVESAFGAAGSVIVILTWVYYSSQILLFGAEFTRVHARHRGSNIRPTSNAVPVTPDDLARQGMTGGATVAEAHPRS